MPAAVLKLWLRVLPDPLIPSEDYGTAIQLARKISEAGNDRSQFDAQVLELFDGCGKVEQGIIQHLAQLCGQVVAQEAANRMGFENLAIVFAPSFFR